ncbi:hypothetical protein C9374_010899 [Naegleria lovaniensis]|uniref:Uncharacterized protein n=1 Tax=Naegleria lovaniensis TaxID=51637 RepID=A0AA88KF87_NAELO|nr:uncharacterized protein C9374_010899 [Naegleria lovaniensis]KAG2374329.1 hypothetical protein C9374_010899 [Naegleria lovaniensis]
MKNSSQNKTTSQPKSSSTSAEESSVSPNFIKGEDNTKELYAKCCLFWKKFGTEFSQWWTKHLSESNRKEILLEVSPSMKEEPPLDKHDYEFTDHLVPELFWKELSCNENALISLCSIYCVMPLEKIEDIEYKRMYAAKDVAFKNVQLPYGKLTAYHDGKFFTLKKDASFLDAQRFMAIVTLCDANTFFLVHQRLSLLYLTIGLIMDEFFEKKDASGQLKAEFEKELSQQSKK